MTFEAITLKRQLFIDNYSNDIYDFVEENFRFSNLLKGTRNDMVNIVVKGEILVGIVEGLIKNIEILLIFLCAYIKD
jgi:hypothetical protein